jgi:hypothetical protein
MPESMGKADGGNYIFSVGKTFLTNIVTSIHSNRAMKLVLPQYSEHGWMFALAFDSPLTSTNTPLLLCHIEK